jgi:peptide-methionine (R)-S-oxide reductase
MASWLITFRSALCKARAQFRVIRSKGTEQAGTGEYEHNKAAGIYSCAACQTPLYRSSTKFDSGSGWPAFFDGKPLLY